MPGSASLFAAAELEERICPLMDADWGEFVERWFNARYRRAQPVFRKNLLWGETPHGKSRHSPRQTFKIASPTTDEKSASAKSCHSRNGTKNLNPGAT